ncbi:MAG: signal recognition particle-docking protein FtsY [Roseitalea sp.]|jgi:fused signal recognition particle receptor|nr:signal recognition particle-docking protein FtsY [Roseitalea sp.]MBO6721835.1 signal recognition particle-docking protein FtsY [Roseitalea sp.]MBO6744851.1 signal recognition particle-docking protein FtsY [Roseitalea sp.]
MAGFLKRIFSFGKKKVEETPDPAALEEGTKAEAADLATPTAAEMVEEAVTAQNDDPGQPSEVPPPAPVEVPPEPAPAPVQPEPEIPQTPEPEPGQPDEVPVEPVPEAPPAPGPAAPPEVPAEPEPAPPTAPERPEPVVPEVPVTPEPPPAVEPPSVPVTPPELAPDDLPAAARTVTIGDDPRPVAPVETEQTKGWLARLTSGLSRSSRQLGDNIASVFTKRKLDDDTLEELEDILIQADLGIETAMRVTDALASTRLGRDVSTEEVRSVMAAEIEKVLGPVAMPLELDLSVKPHVILVVGVNGTGKTTTIGKLAAKLRAAGLSVTLGAGDTFRAAAIEQLKIWSERTGSAFVGTKLGADAAGLAYDAYEQARDNGSDVVIIDTAGRLQNKAELMDELAKIVRVLQKHDPDAPHTVLQTLDATTGQNALSQVEIFRNVAGVNGLVMTKLDGTARGGILVAISAKFNLPVYFIGVGEGVDDLEPFRAADFAHAIAGTPVHEDA